MTDDTLYQDLILERARAPRHAGRLACADAEAEGNNPMCGDRLSLQLRLAPDGTIAEAAHTARGCAISLASADLLADAVRGLGPGEARRLAASFTEMVRSGEEVPSLGDLRALAGVHAFRSRIRCATLAWSALEAALGTFVNEVTHG